MPDSPQSPFSVARFLLESARATGVVDMTPMKLMKLAYVSHGWVLCFNNQPLLAEPVRAWKFGPVIESLYHYLKRYGNAPIEFSEIGVLPQLEVGDQTTSIMRGVWGSYKDRTGLQLSALTHKPGTPWYLTWYDRGGKNVKSATIDNLSIRDHYKTLLRVTRTRAEGVGVPG